MTVLRNEVQQKAFDSKIAGFRFDMIINVIVLTSFSFVIYGLSVEHHPAWAIGYVFGGGMFLRAVIVDTMMLVDHMKRYVWS